MNACKNCGVSLDSEMTKCPLCGLETDAGMKQKARTPSDLEDGSKTYLGSSQMPFIREILTILFISVLLITISINLAVSGTISWSQFPISAAIVLFCYGFVFTYFKHNTGIAITMGLVSSSILLFLLDKVTSNSSWEIFILIPILFSGSILAGLSQQFILKFRKLSPVAVVLIGLAVFCLFIEIIISFYASAHIQLRWSLIVLACTLPLSIVILLVHYRLIKNPRWQRTFHI